MFFIENFVDIIFWSIIFELLLSDVSCVVSGLYIVGKDGF